MYQGWYPNPPKVCARCGAVNETIYRLCEKCRDFDDFVVDCEAEELDWLDQLRSQEDAAH